MMYSISLTIIAMMFGGIMEKTGQLEVIVEVLLRKIKSVTGLITMTVFTCIFSNMTMPEQYISIVVPGSWNTCGVFMTGILGVSTFQYGKWAFFNYLMPIAVILLSIPGITVAKIEDDPDTIIETKEI
ncbi:Na+/H+ antiporter family protein [Keratinibaculum paraultunense]|uniref:Na+/H+ antiporter family protein n=1 Tax=Keratinibaculum paraultunense TaxID=1278232 RepID=A0A4R3KZG0_9FIRM|nr:Na+/H+ antiporter NhaC family protein [Keratinibaculum paraultunense]TCS90797.1 Na+/H+ antiporter family protein [Keratinibaculum paraultunense]